MHDVRRASRDRVPALSAMLARAFADDPIFALFDGGSGDRVAGIRRFFDALDGPLAEAGVLWEIDGAAAAAWIPPDATDVWTTIDDATRPTVRALSTDGGARLESMWDWTLARIPDEPLWILDHIGVEPHMQGRGLGRALIEHGLQCAQRDGVSAFLETAVADNVPVYERFGFSVTDHGVAAHGGPPIWLMRTTA